MQVLPTSCLLQRTVVMDDFVDYHIISQLGVYCYCCGLLLITWIFYWTLSLVNTIKVIAAISRDTGLLFSRLSKSVNVSRNEHKISVIVSNSWFFQSIYILTGQISHCVNSLKKPVNIHIDWIDTLTVTYTHTNVMHL